jgi:hypothetical protein
VLTANQIRDNPLAVPIGELLIQLREQSPSMMRAHKIKRLEFAALCAAIGEVASRDGKNGSEAFARSQNILDEVGERLTPGWFQKQVDKEIADIYEARARLNDFRRDGDSEFIGQCRWLEFIVLNEFSGSKNIATDDAMKKVMG